MYNWLGKSEIQSREMPLLATKQPLVRFSKMEKKRFRVSFKFVKKRKRSCFTHFSVKKGSCFTHFCLKKGKLFYPSSIGI